MKAATFDKGFKVEKPVILLYLLPMLGKGTFFSSCFGCRGHVIKACEETARLSCDDRDRQSSSKVMKDEALL